MAETLLDVREAVSTDLDAILVLYKHLHATDDPLADAQSIENVYLSR